eukprot:gene7307-8124_t
MRFSGTVDPENCCHASLLKLNSYLLRGALQHLCSAYHPIPRQSSTIDPQLDIYVDQSVYILLVHLCATPRSTSIQCPGGKPIHWTKTEPDKGDLSFSYTCGDSKAEKVIKLSCKKGYKPTYRKDLIPKRMIDAALSEISKRGSVVYGPEPNFGLFSSGAKFDVLDSASIVSATVTSELDRCVLPLRLIGKKWLEAPKKIKVQFLKTDRPFNNLEKDYFFKEARIGLAKGMQECGRQFRWERWNCQLSDKIKKKIMERKYVPKVTKEVAFLNAMTSSAIAVHLATICRRGETALCSSPEIDPNLVNYRSQNQEEIREEQTKFGLWITEYFTDSFVLRYSQRLARILAIRHNNKIGRNVVRYMVKRTCKCHGASGMCMLKTCAGILPSLNEIGTTLKFLYTLSHKGRVDKNKVLKPGNEDRPVNLADMLIHLTDSTDYCKKNKSYGSLGTLGRTCQAPLKSGTKEASPGHCNTLCHKCGYTTKYTLRRKRRPVFTRQLGIKESAEHVLAFSSHSVGEVGEEGCRHFD